MADMRGVKVGDQVVVVRGLVRDEGNATPGVVTKVGHKLVHVASPPGSKPAAYHLADGRVEKIALGTPSTVYTVAEYETRGKLAQAEARLRAYGVQVMRDKPGHDAKVLLLDALLQDVAAGYGAAS